MALEQELATFDREFPQLLRTMRGQFVLIHGEDTTGPYRSEDDAYVAGCEKYGVEPFLVMLVEENERPIPLLQDVPPYNGNMNEIPPDVMADLQAVADAAAAGRPVDPEVARRVQERSQKVRDELLRKYGVREIAVDLVRQGREE